MKENHYFNTYAQFKVTVHLYASTNSYGERGGSVVERRTPEREVGGSKLAYLRRVVSLSKTLYSPKYW